MMDQAFPFPKDYFYFTNVILNGVTAFCISYSSTEGNTMAELKRASCIRCGYRSRVITFGAGRRERYNGWPAMDKSTNQVIEVILFNSDANAAYALYYFSGEASRKFKWVEKQIFENEQSFKHKCPRCGSFRLVFELEALAD